MGTVKFIGCWACIIATLVLMVLAHGVPGVTTPLAILAIAFAVAPTNG